MRNLMAIIVSLVVVGVTAGPARATTEDDDYSLGNKPVVNNGDVSVKGETGSKSGDKPSTFYDGESQPDWLRRRQREAAAIKAFCGKDNGAGDWAGGRWAGLCQTPNPGLPSAPAGGGPDSEWFESVGVGC